MCEGNCFNSISQLLEAKLGNCNAAQFLFIFFKEKINTELEIHYNVGVETYNYVSHINIGVDDSTTAYFRHDNMVVYQDESQTYLSDLALSSSNMTYLVLAKDTEKGNSSVSPYDRAKLYEKSEAGHKRKVKYESSEEARKVRKYYESSKQGQEVRKDY